MGVKRPFDEEFQQSSSKQAKQLDSDNAWSSVTEDFSSDKVTETACDRGEAADNFDKFLLLKDFENKDFRVTSSLADKELETSVPLSWVTSSSSEEDAGSGELFPSSLFAEYFPFNFPRRTVPQLEDAYSSLMNCSPRKPIPIGPDHQADIPPWDPSTINDENDPRVGTCVISESLSEDSSYGDVKIGQGRKECDCMEVGSVRCVRQHVKEARDKLREVLGDERFSNLGFYDMGEEVSCKWTEEDEGIFHEVIYSNPVSLGKNFWRQLPAAFPDRTMKDLVSYYFNVFMLRRRAVQNRTSSLEIDSDDDEWHANDRTIFGRVGDDDDEFPVESFGVEDGQVGSEDDNPYDDEEDGDDEDDDDSDDGDGDGEVDGRTSGEDASNKDDPRSQNLKSHVYQLHDDTDSDCLLTMVDPTEIREDHNLLEDSSTSCESQLYNGGSCVSFGLGYDTHSSAVRDNLTGSLTGESNDSSDGYDSGFFLDHGYAKGWDESCSTGLARGVDLLPTCNMIEEIFGPCSSKGSN